MKLSKRELELVRNLDKIQTQKVKGLIATSAVLAVYVILRVVGVLREFDIPVDSLLIIFFAAFVGNTFAKVRPEDRYVELLRRYVNRDADTLAALASKNDGD